MVQQQGIVKDLNVISRFSSEEDFQEEPDATEDTSATMSRSTASCPPTAEFLTNIVAEKKHDAKFHLATMGHRGLHAGK